MMFRKPVRFVKRRKSLGLTQREVAEALGVTSRTIQSWELGENMPRLAPLQMLKLCRVLKCSLEELAADFHPDNLTEPMAADKPGRYETN